MLSRALFLSSNQVRRAIPLGGTEVLVELCVWHTVPQVAQQEHRTMRPRQEEMNSAGSTFLNEVANQVPYLISPLPSLSGVADCLVICTACRTETYILTDIDLLFVKVCQHICREVKCQRNAYASSSPIPRSVSMRSIATVDNFPSDDQGA